MGWRFRKTIKILPGIKLNLSKTGASLSVGPKGATFNISSRGTKFTTSIPGTGLSYTTQLSGNKPKTANQNVCPHCGHKMRKQWENCPKCNSLLITNPNTECENVIQPIEIYKGQRGFLSDYLNIKQNIEINLFVDGQAIYDYVCFGLNTQGLLSNERYMIFYNQPSAPKNVIVSHTISNGNKFIVNVGKLPVSIKKLLFAVCVDGNGTMGEIISHNIEIIQNNNIVLHTSMSGNDFSNEKAIVSLELYRKEDWKFNIVASGYNGGLGDLLRSVGGSEA